MKSKFIEEQICYTGKELAPHWIYKNFHIQGDAVVSFIGECEVKLTEMVDIEDVISNSPIYSKKMLHFIVEHFNMPLVEGVLRQRLFVNIAKEAVEAELKKGEIKRDGDDLFFNKGKLSVSIAAKSMNSVLIHFAMNIDSLGTPVHTAGLETDMNITDCKKIAQKIMLNYCKECEEILNASCKVRGVY